MKAEQIALASITVRAEAARDILGTLHRLAAMGYRGVELAGIGNALPAEVVAALGLEAWAVPGTGELTPRDVRAALDNLGMRATSILIGWPAEQSWSVLVDYAATLGVEYVVFAWVPPDLRANAADVQRLAERFNRLGERFHTAGLQFVYHNHDYEFAPLDGTTGFEILTSATDPELVKLEIDVYWACYAGQDPAALIRRFAGRVPLVHMKDMAAGDARPMAAVGAGILSWPEILAAADSAGTKWYIVEHDDPDDPLQVAEISLRYLQALAG